MFEKHPRQIESKSLSFSLCSLRLNPVLVLRIQIHFFRICVLLFSNFVRRSFSPPQRDAFQSKRTHFESQFSERRTHRQRFNDRDDSQQGEFRSGSNSSSSPTIPVIRRHRRGSGNPRQFRSRNYESHSLRDDAYESSSNHSNEPSFSYSRPTRGSNRFRSQRNVSHQEVHIFNTLISLFLV